MGVMTDEEILRKYADDLVRFAIGLIGPFDAQDVVTDACLGSFRAKGWPQVSWRREQGLSEGDSTIAGARCASHRTDQDVCNGAPDNKLLDHRRGQIGERSRPFLCAGVRNSRR